MIRPFHLMHPSPRPFGKLRATPLPLAGEGPGVRAILAHAANVSALLLISVFKQG